MKRVTTLLSIFAALALTACGGGSSNSPASGNDASVRNVVPGTPPWGSGTGLDAAVGHDAYTPVDTKKADVSADTPRADVAIDTSKADVLPVDIGMAEAGACAIGQACTTDSDCQSGQSCLNYSQNGGAKSNICVPTKCETCTTGQTCVVDTKNTCDFVSCRSDDGGVTDAPKVDAGNGVDATVVDATPPDTTPVPLDAMPPSWAAACELAATEPCGGDITGTWNIVGNCDNWMSETEFAKKKGGICATFADSVDTGAFVFNSDSTCKRDETLTYKIDVDVNCLTDNNSTCSEIDKVYKDAIGAQGTEEMIAGECNLSAEGNNCHCERTYDFTGISCLYTVTGTSYTMTYSDGSQGTHDYCVRGDVLSIFYPAYSSVGTAIGANEVFVLKRAN